MPKKTITIFITTFIIVGIIILVVYSFLNKKDTETSTTEEIPWYQNFNPFGTGGNTTNVITEPGTENTLPETGGETQTSRFHQITDFAIAGATFLEETRLINNTGDGVTQSEQIKTIIPADTKEGRKEIQAILNETLSLNPPLKIDGVFGKSATQAIKDFQKLNNIDITGIVDATTAPYFTKTATTADKSLFEQAPSIRFVEKMNGHIYKMFLDTKTKDKISNSTIPGIHESFFNKTANTVIYRYLGSNKIISSFMATLGAPKGDFLPQNISDLSVSKDKTKFFYITENNNGSTGTMGVFGETKRDAVFTSPFTEWLSEWDDNGRIFLTTKASYSATGSMFFLNTNRKTISKLFGNIIGLTTKINGKGTLVLYSTSTDTGPKLSVINLSEHTVKDLDTYGLPEKCVWSKNNIDIYCGVPNTITGNQYPDVWYQGLVSFDDYFVKINTTTGDKVTLANSKNETAIDATHLFLDNIESSLFFTNKKDSTLWSLDIK